MSNSEYLMHYKYIKREWKNGKWVYTYPDGSTHKINRTLDTLGYHKKADAIDKLNEYRVASAKAAAEDPSPRNSNAYKRAQQAATDAAIDANVAVNEYYKTPVGILDKLDDEIDAGRNFVANLLKAKLPKVANSIRPKEEYLPKLLKKR